MTKGHRNVTRNVAVPMCPSITSGISQPVVVRNRAEHAREVFAAHPKSSHSRSLINSETASLRR
jgi:hypothetical protein